MSIRGVVILAAVLCAAPLTVLAAQQPTVSAPIAAPPAAPAQVSAPVAPLPVPGPALSPQFERTAPALARSPMAAGGNHTIVISTLALVLGIIIIVLLVTR